MQSSLVLVAIFALGLGSGGAGQPTRRDTAGQPPAKYWVYFVDKGQGAPLREAAIKRTESNYSPRAIKRRMLRGPGARGQRLFTERDLPVASGYLREVEQAGAVLIHQSRWMNAVSVRAKPEELAAISRLPFVRKVEPVRGIRRLPQPETTQVAAMGGDPFYGLSYDQLQVINLPALHSQGFTGEGVVIGVLDTGFLRTHVAFNDPQHPLSVVAEYDFVDDDPNAAVDPGDPGGQHSHGTWILGTMGAYKVGDLVGGAFDASFVLCKTEDTTQEVPIEEDNYVAGLEFIEQHGSDIATSSLGYPDFYDYEDLDGQTAVTTQAVNIATDLGIVCLTAAGNGGHTSATPTLIPPGDAFDVITVGAVGLSGVLASLSADGPTADGRLKPEVLAVGAGATSVSSNIDTTYTSGLSGTSLSTPMVAAAVACILQAHPDWTVPQIRQNLFETSNYFLSNGEPDPASEQGYGIVNAYQAAQDCDANGVADLIDINAGSVFDANHNGIPDVCEPPPLIPSVSGWGVAALALSVCIAASLVLPCRRPRC